MPTIERAVDFLIRNESLALGGSPWPSYGEDQDVYRIDWERLFPGNDRSMEPLGGSSEWGFHATSEELSQVQRLLGVGPSALQKARVDPEPQWDTCAWYQPVHFFGHDWGIFVKEANVFSTALMIAPFVDATVLQTASLETWVERLRRAATYIYFLHEHYHHKIECLSLRLNVVKREAVYSPYMQKVYKPALGTDSLLEEALANADAFSRLGHRPYSTWLSPPVVKAAKKYLKWQFLRDPPGYRMASHYLSSAKFDAGENELQAQVKESSPAPTQPRHDWDLAPRMTQSFFPVTSNIWTVVPAGTKSRLPLTPVIPARTCSTQEMIELYKSIGYTTVDGGKGSHLKLKKAGAPTMILPGGRKELSPGVAKTALQVLGRYTLNDLPSLLKGELRVVSGR